MSDGCVYACWNATRCPTCNLNMPPRGRSVPMAAAGAYCQCDHASDAKMNPRHLWSEHDSDRAYTDQKGMRPGRWLAWKLHTFAAWLHRQAALWLSWEQGKDY